LLALKYTHHQLQQLGRKTRGLLEKRKKLLLGYIAGGKRERGDGGQEPCE
jgi:hypothetical protein